MKRYLLRGLVLSCLAMCIAMPSSTYGKRSKPHKASTSQGDFNHPDFAYPATTSENALKVLRGSGSDADKVLALIQYSIAASSISTDSIASAISMADSLAVQVKQPYRSVVYALEAQIYADIYEANRGVYNDRLLPSETANDNFKEWNARMFRDKVLQLIERATADLDMLADTPSGAIAQLYIDSKYNKEEYPSVASVLVSRLAQLPRIGNPYALSGGGGNIQDRVIGLADSLLQIYASSPGNEAAYMRMALIKNDLLQSGNHEWLESTYNRLKDTQWCIPVLIGLRAYTYDEAQKRNYYNLANEVVKKFPEGKYRPNLQNIITEMSRQSVTLTGGGQYLSTQQIELNADVANATSFFVHLYKLKGDATNIEMKNLNAQATYLKTIPVTISDTIPFSKKITVKLDNPGYGNYCVTASPSDNPKLEIPYSSYRNVSAFRVSDLTMASATDDVSEHPGRVYVASAANFAPIADASVTLKPRGNTGKGLTREITYKTNTDGYIEAKEGYFDVKIQKGNDRLSSWFSKWNSSSKASRERLKATVLTDLPIYHPGDSASFSVIAYTHRDRDMRSAPDREISAVLLNANYIPVDTLKLKTDAYGRCNGSFAIPDKGLLGQWSIMVREGDETAGSASMQVEEYKAPTFMVETLPMDDESIRDLDTLTVAGRAATFSGMPLQDATVSYTVSYGSRWGFGSTPQNVYAGTCTTDMDGRFQFTLPLQEMKSETMRYGVYTLNIAVTSLSGETQNAAAKTFVVDLQYNIVLNAPAKINVTTGKLKLGASVYDQMRREVNTPLQYTLVNSEGKSVRHGTFTGQELVIDATGLASGKYIFNVNMADDPDNKASADIILWRESDKTPPVESVLWLPTTEYVAEHGAKEVSVRLGSSYADSYVLAEVSDLGGIISQQWIKADGEMLTLAVPAPEADNRIMLRLGACHNTETATATATIYPSTIKDDLEVEVTSMRDKTTAGAQEKWTFRFNFAGKGAANIPVIATMTDRALNEIAPFVWSLNPRSAIQYSNPASLSLLKKQDYYNSFMLNRILTADEYSAAAPTLQTYGRNLFNPYGSYLSNSRGVVYATAAMKSMGAMEGMVYEEAAMATDSASEAKNEVKSEITADEASTPAESAAEVRDTEHPLAFFKPNLSTDSQGNVELSFTVPNFNTTWQLQIAGYTPQMYSAVGKYYSVSSKPVMTSLNLPRFLRTGDVVELSASIFNAQEQPADVEGIIEVYNPLTGEILACTSEGAQAMKAASQRVVRLRFTAPDNCSAVGVRSTARCGGFSDAEQALVAILPSSSPVIESQTFYLQPSENEFEMNLNPQPSESTVTLQYCDNPVWYCVTALPSMTIPEDCGILARMGDYVARALANGLVCKYPELGEAIRYWQQANAAGDDTTLTSALQLNEQLKTLGLDNTTWVNDATAETMRMQNLASLLDTETNDETLREVLFKITSQQHKDGGFGWMPEWKSSEFVTESLLKRFAVLRQIGVSYTDYPFAPKAMAYIDAQVYKRYQENKRQISADEATNWLYLSSFYPIRRSSKIEKMRKQAYATIQKDWKSLDIDGKSRAAIVLSRGGDVEAAKSILESIRQFATMVPSRGMYFDNLNGGWSGLGKLLVTAHVLEAYAEILPDDAATDRLRQWLILQRQTQNWGESNVTSEVIAAILTSGSKWTTESQPAKITVGGTTINPDAAERYTGNLTQQIEAPVDGAQLTITREAQGPAWVAVIAQSIKPIETVEEYGINGLSISKAVYALTEKGNLIEATGGDYCIGDKVRVTLTVTNRDDLQCVAITDERGACFEPVVQLSQYCTSDRIWYYQELRNTQTNLLIDYLPKGTHVITYDCYLGQLGTFTIGIATVQSQYAPSITAHSKGQVINVKSEN